ncbi:MAG TPA: helix-hairpin-helix domain-containing protein [Candidatus Acidoferrales bacterium]
MNWRRNAAWFVLHAAVASFFFCAANAALAQKKIPPAEPLDLNSASAEQLQQIPGIGPVMAQSIVKFREKSGPFQRVEDVLAIHGISKRVFAEIRPYLTVKPPGSTAPK